MGHHFLSFQELLSSTNIKKCVHVKLSGKENTSEIIILRASRIEYYEILPENGGEKAIGLLLHLKASFVVSGNVESIKKLRCPWNSNKDLLMLGVPFAKLSIVEYDEDTNTLKTISIQNFEEKSIGPGTELQGARNHGAFQLKGISKHVSIQVDPEGRCAAMVICNDQLVVVPLMHSSHDFDADVEEEHNDIILPRDRMVADNEPEYAVGYKAKQIIQRPFILILSKLGVTGRILDIAFLEKYVEPTIMILHETKPTWDGRFATSRDNCSLTVLSLNVVQRLHPMIWNADGLPYNALKIVPVPDPIGGVLVLCTNAILYFNQTQYFGLSLNTGFGASTVNPAKFPLLINPYELNIMLSDDTQYEFLTPQEFIFTLENGSMYILDLQLSATSKQKLCIREIGIQVMTFTTTICQIPNRNMLFFGSQTDDALLLSYTCTGNQAVDDVEPSNKRQKVEESANVVKPHDGSDDDSEDDLLLYGTEEPEQPQTTSDATAVVASTHGRNEYTFQVLDSLVNVGQITSHDIGKTYAEEDPDDENTPPDQLDMLITGGYGKSGSLSILHRGLRPTLGTEAELGACSAMWTVREGDGLEEMDSYLILSVGAGSMVLSTKEDEMEPVDEVAFYSDGATLGAGNFFNNARIVQIYREGIRIIHDKTCTQELATESDLDVGGLGMNYQAGLTITLVDILDPYIVLCISDGTLRVVKGDPEDYELVAEMPSLETADTITAISMFHDLLHMFPEVHEDTAQSSPTVDNASKKSKSTMDIDVDDDDALYGNDEDDSTEDNISVISIEDDTTVIDDDAQVDFLHKPEDSEIYCAVCRESGQLEIYRMKDFKLLAVFPYIAYGPSMLINSLQERNMEVPLGVSGDKITSPEQQFGPPSVITDIMIHRVGPVSENLNANKIAKLTLSALLVNGDMLLYEAVILPPLLGNSSPRYRFRRIATGSICRPLLKATTQSYTAAGATKQNEPTPANGPSRVLKMAFRYPMFTRFGNINGRSGIFYRGARPAWITCDRGRPMVIPMDIPKEVPSNSKANNGSTVPVLCFTPFHNSTCLQGFIYFHCSGFLRVCQLPSSQEAVVANDGNACNGNMTIHKIPLKCTPHFISYLGGTGTGAVTEALKIPTYAVVVSTQQVWEPEPEHDDEMYGNENGEGNELPEEKPIEILPIDIMDKSVCPPIMEEKYELRLMQSNTWDVKGVFQFTFDRFEVVLCLKLMYLSDTSQHANQEVSVDEWKEKRRPYLVVSTGFAQPEGEDVAGQGRLLLFEIDYAQYVTETEDGPSSQKVPKLKLTFEKEHKSGSVTMLTQMGQYVLAAIGSKIIVYQLKSEQLVGCAFYDAQVYIVSMKSIKNIYVIYGDIHKSVHLLRWQEFERSLTLLAKDFMALPVFSVEFSVNEHNLGILATDENKNLSVFDFAPTDIKSRGGQQLLLQHDFHLNAHITSMHRLRIDASNLVSSKSKNRFATIITSVEASIGILVPVSERIFRRLFTLQTIMVNALPQCAGFNPREFRQFQNLRNDIPFHPRSCKKGVLDGPLLFRYATLDFIAQKELAKCIGTTPEVVIQNLLEIELGCHFL